MKPLRSARLDAGWTQDDAADLLGRTQQFLSACERGLRNMNSRDEARLRSVLEDEARQRSRDEAALSAGHRVLRVLRDEILSATPATKNTAPSRSEELNA